MVVLGGFQQYLPNQEILVKSVFFYVGYTLKIDCILIGTIQNFQLGGVRYFISVILCCQQIVVDSNPNTTFSETSYPFNNYELPTLFKV